MDYLISINLCIYKISLELLKKCIISIFNQSYKNFELIIICDGVEDNNILEYIKTITTAKVFYQSNKGISNARNLFLQHATGDIITYIDCDNYWNNDYLKKVNNIYQDVNIKTAYAKFQFIVSKKIFFIEFDYEKLKKYNTLDINIFSHRKQIYELFGGFDEKLNRLVDWDFFLTCTKEYPPKFINYIGAFYNDDNNLKNRISIINPYNYNHYQITKKHNLIYTKYVNKKILYIVFHYKQLSETYIDWEMEWLVERGANIEIFVDCQIIPSPIEHNFKIHTKLDEAIQSFKPNHIHIHWLNIYEKYSRMLSKYNIPITIRTHGFELSTQLIKTMSMRKIKYILVYPHFYDSKNNKLLKSLVPFNPKIHYPPPTFHYKDTRLVIRVGSGLPTKDIILFLKLANEIDDFKFTLCIIKCSHMEYYIDELINENKKLGGKCNILINVPREEIADLMRKSFIYLHTTGETQSYGQPISIAEAMACGNYIIGKKRDDATKKYINNAGVVYTNYEEAKELLLNTLKFNNQDWQNIYNTSIEHSYTTYTPEKAIADFL
jgi:glycosyltransferase involved in cell wall biosynthesis